MVRGAKTRQSTTTPVTFRFPSFTTRIEHDYRDQSRVETLLEDQICIIHSLLTPLNCSRLLSFFKDCIVPHLSAPVAPRRGEATRTNERWAIHDPAFAESLFVETDLKASLESHGLAKSGNRHLVGLNPNIRVYHYQVGSFFGPHYDDSVTDPVTKWKSEWTLLIYLTEGDLLGGETSFETQKGKSLAPEVKDGMALIHRHGKDCLLHEGKSVKQGTKWVLRSDLMYSL